MSLNDDTINRLIDVNLRDRKEMSSGMTICVSIIVVVVILILFGMLMKSPPGVQMIRTLKKQNSRQKSKTKLVQKPRRRSAPVQRKKMFRAKQKPKRTRNVRRRPSTVNLTRRRIKTTMDPNANASSSTTATAPRSLSQYALSSNLNIKIYKL